jgi:hypothetical protein
MTQCTTYENSTVPPQGIEVVLVSIRREVYVGFFYAADTVRDSRNLRMTFPASKMSASIAARSRTLWSGPVRRPPIPIDPS